MLLRKFAVQPVKIVRAFSAPVKKEYDWRDDITRNPDITTADPRYQVGQINIDEMPMPYEHEPDTWQPAYSRTYNYNDASIIYDHRLSNHHYPPTEQYAAYWDPDNDVAHEIDYGSEDLDFQPDDFKTQHFKKKGFMWPFLLVAALPWLYFWNEYLAQGFPDRDHWKMPLPPPTDYPDEETADTSMYNAYNSHTGRTVYDAGRIVPLGFDMVDGKKIYKRFTCANQPMSKEH